MSNKKHKGDHGRREEKRAAVRTHAPEVSAPARKPRRVFVRNPLYILATAAIIVGMMVVLVFCEKRGWFDTVIGSVVSVLLTLFTVVCVYDLALLLTACITFGDGQVNLGKNDEGQLMLIHAASVVRVEVQGKDGKPLPAAPVYKQVELAFLMESGRVNRKKLSRLTAKQLERILVALEAEKGYGYSYKA